MAKTELVAKENRIPLMRSEKVFYFVNGTFLTLFLLVTLYPILNLIANGVSEPSAIYTGKVTWYPSGFTLEGFKTNLMNDNIILGYKNTFIYAFCGTALTVCTTLLTGFALSRKELIGRSAISFFFAFTMWFSGGLIPSYLLIRDLGMYNTRWAIIIPGMVNVWYVIVCRTNINSTISEEMYEAASIDGCSYWRFFTQFVVPLCKPVVAVIMLWVAIGHWNSYFSAMLYLTTKDLKPLQLFLRDYLVVSNTVDVSAYEFTTEALGRQEQVKNSLILMSVLPLWALYPFIQKFFVKGVMVGAVKG